MKRCIALCAGLMAAALGFAQTKTPISSLNPAGSTAGQVILSTGASTAPTWGTAGLAAIAGNRVLANATASSAVPTALAMPSCSGANNALLWQTSTGFTCGANFALTTGNLSQFAATTSAQLAGVLSNETGSGVVVFATSPTITTPNLVGETTAAVPAAGSIGEYISQNASAVAISTGVATNCTSKALTAGDYDVYGSITYAPQATTTVQTVQAGLSTTSATMPGAGRVWTVQGSLTTGASQSGSVPYQRIKLTGAGTVYLVGLSVFGVSTMTMTCNIDIRRAA